MSYAQAFNEIFSRTFRPTYCKPRLKKVRGFWVCQSADRPETKGFTPASAYGAWRNLRDEGPWEPPRGIEPSRPWPRARCRTCELVSKTDELPAGFGRVD